jgi:hypothetical protein
MLFPRAKQNIFGKTFLPLLNIIKNILIQNKKGINKLTDILAFAVFIFIGVSLILLFLYLHNSQEVQEYLNKINSSDTTAGFKLIVIYGIVKLLSILLGLAITIAVFYRIFQDIKNKKNTL